MSGLSGRHIVLGVSGGIAAYKAIELCRRLVDAGARVTPVLSENSTRFVGAATFAALATDPPIVGLWGNQDPSPHTTLARSADLVVVAPATARIVASLANGSSDDALATTLIATRSPVVLCPAMHTEMWEHPAVVDNISLLRRRGVLVVDPESGALAGGDIGVGRLASTDSILEAVAGALAPQDLAGKTVLVTAGGTREPIDPIRFIGNRSSGKQGYAIATEAAARGAHVVLITSSHMKAPVSGAVHVETADEMHKAVVANLDAADIVVMAAAVADFRPARTASNKLKKHDGVPELVLEPTVDILSDIAQRRRDDQVIIGFAAETNDVESYARDKLSRKKLDFVVANDISGTESGIGVDDNEALILGADGGAFATGRVGKRTVASALFDRVAVLLGE